MGRRNCLLSVPESSPAATDLDLKNFLRAILDARMRRAVSLPEVGACC